MSLGATCLYFSDQAFLAGKMNNQILGVKGLGLIFTGDLSTDASVTALDSLNASTRKGKESTYACVYERVEAVFIVK